MDVEDSNVPRNVTIWMLKLILPYLNDLVGNLYDFDRFKPFAEEID